MNKFVLRQSLILLLTATIWGSAFVAQSVGMEYIEPFTFNAARNLIGAAALLPCIALLRFMREREASAEQEKNVSHLSEEEKEMRLAQGRKNLLTGGISCGVILFIASNLQQFGIQYTTVGKAGFITAMYIVLVPLAGIFLKKKVHHRVWFGVMLAVVGLYMLCMTGGVLFFQMGDLLVLFCAVTFTVHILVIDYFAPRVDGVKMSCIQFWVCGVLSAVCMFLFEKPDVGMIRAAWAPILYAGILSSGVGYTLQIVGQKGMNPTVASLILSLESVFSVIAGWLILGQALSGRELFGCGLMLVAIILVQIPAKSE